MLLFWVTCFILANANIAISEVAPYVIFTTHFGVHRVHLNVSSSVETLVEGGRGYGAVDYHYRRNLLFWINDVSNTIHEARLSDGASASLLITTSDPVDLTIDWINDKLYWVDSAECEIRELDIMTNATRFIMSTGTSDTSFPRGIVIYPYMDNGWLYWTDQTSGSLEMGSINGGNRESLITNLPCVQALTIDYPSHTVYWADTCLFSFHSLSLNGDRESLSYPFAQIVFFVSAMGKFNENLYWVEPSGIYTVGHSGDGYSAVMSASSNQRPISMQVVHPSQQPPDEEYRDIILDPGETEFVCDPPCNEEHGACIPPGLCACSKGWMGTTCSEDIDECTAEMDGCEHVCTNYAGGYNCSCYSGFSLSNNSRSCSDINECVETPYVCEHDCSNFPGGYDCSCKSGYSLNVDLHTCSDIDECLSHTDKCQQICINNKGGYSCSCYEGYLLEHNNLTCIDVDECTAELDDCQQTCTNNDGGFNCSCDSGYLLNSDMKTCRIEVESSFTINTSAVSIVTPNGSQLASTHLPTPRSSMPTRLSPTTAVAASSVSNSTTVLPSVSLTSTIESNLSLLLSRTNSVTQTTTPTVLSVTTSSNSFRIDVLTTTTLETVSVSPTFATTRHSLYSSLTSILLATTELHTLSSYSSLTPSPSTDVTSIPTIQPIMSTVYSTMDSVAATSILEDSTIVSTTAPNTSSIAEVAPTASPGTLSATEPGHISQSVRQRVVSEMQATASLESTALPTTHDLYPATQMFTRATTSSYSKANILSSHIPKSSIAMLSVLSNISSDHVTSSQQIFPSARVIESTNNIQWYTENRLAFIIVAIGVVPAIAALVVLGMVLWYRRWHDTGSWYPNHNIPDVVVDDSAPHVDTVQDGQVAMPSFRSLHEEKKE